ncbi:hypothetical protein OBP_220 [Pseudomonas phage OBP]|uniref:hypothetical protein n=1 Tax=Pseudomonas phage OBP TaxID=1124849 RepID=UPI000240D5C0|nr:hypothetical protein OBP_220 [Pseudomonas phage OBP]AEV89657.1 hypothetical protein OBP_220 [Pseudomonas phage OBP]
MKREIEVNLIDMLGDNSSGTTPELINIENIATVGSNNNFNTGTIRLDDGKVYYTKESYSQLRDKIEEAKILRECYTVKMKSEGKRPSNTHYIPLESVDLIEVNSETNHVTLWCKGTRFNTGMTGIELRKTIIKLPM